MSEAALVVAGQRSAYCNSDKQVEHAMRSSQKDAAESRFSAHPKQSSADP